MVPMYDEIKKLAETIGFEKCGETKGRLIPCDTRMSAASIKAAICALRRKVPPKPLWRNSTTVKTCLFLPGSTPVKI